MTPPSNESTPALRERVEELRGLLERYNRAYYQAGSSEVSDAEYDALFRELSDLEGAHPDLRRGDSPTQRVGAPLEEGTSFEKVEHAVPMLSIASLFTVEEVREFVEKMQRFLGLDEDTELAFHVEPKFDGVSASLIYEDGVFVRGVTRGDGSVGEDVTQNLRTVRNIPLRLDTSKRPAPSLLEVRGEVLIDRQRFVAFNQQREAEGGSRLANSRNATAGAIRRNDPSEVRKYPLELHVYDAPRCEGLEFGTQEELMAALKDWGLPDSGHGEQVLGLQAALDYHDRLEAGRDDLPFEVDGVVCKLDRLDLRARLGANSRSTRWQYAHKFAAIEAVTTLRAIELQVGANGRLTPRAHVEAVEVMGVTVRHTTLHNADHVKNLGLHIGARVFLKRAGDVIPQITGVATPADSQAPKDWDEGIPESLRTEGGVQVGAMTAWREEFAMAERCPACDTEVLAEGKYFRCPNVHGCRPQLVGRTLLMAGRGGFEVESLGEKMVEQLFEAGLMNTPADLFVLDQLEREQLTGLDRWGDRSVDNLLREIDEAREVPLARFLSSLGIPDVGPSTGRLLAQNFGGLEALRAADAEALEAIDGIGPEVARKVIEWFADDRNQAVITRLLDDGRVRPQAPEAQSEGPFAGKSVVFTGTLEGMTRAEAKKVVEDQGARVASSVSKKTDFLVVGGKPGSKAKKAEDLGVTVLLEEQFLAQLRGE